MASGNTITGSLADSLDTVVDSARVIRDYEGVMSQLCDKVTLSPNSGLSWDEILLARLIAQRVTETTVLDNPQQYSDTKLTITPTMVGLHTVVTERTKARISKKTLAKYGMASQSALQLLKDQDGITVLDGATTSLGGAGTTLTSGIIGAAVSRILSNATEPGQPPIYFVGHGYQIKDIQDELTSGIGTYNLPEGESARVFAEGFAGKVYSAMTYVDGNITIDSSSDSKGGVFAKQAIVLVQGMSPKVYTQFHPEIGGGADVIYLYDEYAWGERSAGNWLYEIYSDTTAPTS